MHTFRKHMSTRALGLGLAVALLMATATAQAASVPFAQFQQTTGSPVNFTNSGGALGTLTLSPPAVPVTFNFLGTSGLPTADRAAVMTLNALSLTPATNAGGVLVQPINGPANAITFTEVGTGKNLLTMIFTGNILGFAGSSNAQLSGDLALGNTVIYTSDYLTFGGPGSNEASYLIGLPQVTPALSIGAGGFLNSFSANAFGSFSSGIAFVPEPASVVMMGSGAALPLWLLLRRRKRVHATATA